MSRKRILIIDDEDDIREVTALVFESAGDFEVITADGGKAGVISAHQSRPDLILLDVMMPEMDGPARLRGCRNRKRRGPFRSSFSPPKYKPPTGANCVSSAPTESSQNRLIPCILPTMSPRSRAGN